MNTQALRLGLRLNAAAIYRLPLTLGVFALLPMTTLACTAEGPTLDPPLAAPEDAGTTPPVHPSIEVACIDSAQRSCRVELGDHDGVVDCFVGVEICSEGVWGPCGDAAPTDPSPGTGGGGGGGGGAA